MTPVEYFQTPVGISQKHDEALRAFFVDHQKAEDVARQFGYTVSALYSLVKDFRTSLNSDTSEDFFFTSSKKGRPLKSTTSPLRSSVVALRTKNFSVPEIKTLLDAQDHTASEGYITRVLSQEGFARLPRRDRQTKMRRQ